MNVNKHTSTTVFQYKFTPETDNGEDLALGLEFVRPWLRSGTWGVRLALEPHLCCFLPCETWNNWPIYLSLVCIMR